MLNPTRPMHQNTVQVCPYIPYHPTMLGQMPSMRTGPTQQTTTSQIPMSLLDWRYCKGSMPTSEHYWLGQIYSWYHLLQMALSTTSTSLSIPSQRLQAKQRMEFTSTRQILQLGIQTWKWWNEYSHGKTIQETHIKTREAAIIKVKNIYSSPPSLLRCFPAVHETSLDACLTKSTWQLLAWLRHITQQIKITETEHNHDQDCYKWINYTTRQPCSYHPGGWIPYTTPTCYLLLLMLALSSPRMLLHAESQNQISVQTNSYWSTCYVAST